VGLLGRRLSAASIDSGTNPACMELAGELWGGAARAPPLRPRSKMAARHRIVRFRLSPDGETRDTEPEAGCPVRPPNRMTSVAYPPPSTMCGK